MEAERRIICVGKLTIIGLDNGLSLGSANGLSPGRHQAIIWTSAALLLIGPQITKFFF